jgi:oligopeptide transport system substrate-binding protein
VLALRRVVDPKSAAPYASQLYPIWNAEKLNSGALKGMEQLGVRAVDRRTLRITLESPTPYFLELLTSFATYPVPKHLIERLGNESTKPGAIVGNGAFVVTGWIPNTEVVSLKNTEFYDANNVMVDKIIYYADENQEALLKRFRAGEIDYAANFPSTEIGWLREHLAQSVRIGPELGINYYAVNFRRAPLSDVRVRRALSMAVDREGITDKMLKTGEIPAYSFVPPSTGNYGEPAHARWRDIPYDRRVITAKHLMQEAGYGPDHPLRLTIRYNTSENYKRVAVAVQQMWSHIGVGVNLENSEVKVHYDALEQGDFDIGRAGWTADYNDAQSFLLAFQTSAGVQNFGRYSNPEYDQIMQSAAVAADPRVRSELLHRAEQMVLDDAAVIPIMYYISKSLVQPYVRGWLPNIRNVHRSRYISLAN